MPENNQDIIRLRGSLQVKLEGADGTIKGERTIENLVVLNGRSRVLWRAINTVTNTDPLWNGISAIALGFSTIAPAATDTNLKDPAYFYTGGWALVSVTTTGVTSNPPRASFSVTLQGSDNGGVGLVVSEIGLYHGVPFGGTFPGNLFSRATFAASTFQSNDTFNCTWTISG